MTIEQNLTGKIDSAVTLAKYWSESMPKKPGKRTQDGKQREWDGLITLLRDFSTFAMDYSTLLSKAPIANQRLILNNGAERLLNNFNILSRASEQRRGAITKDSPGYYLAYAEDKLIGYCNQWLPDRQFHSSYVTLKNPVVYFEKTYGILRALYTPEIPVISIPLTEYNELGQWLALAHEMGHHIYWNSLTDQEEINKLHEDIYKLLAKQVNLPEGVILGLEPAKLFGGEILRLEPWGQWMEEIFADICGVLFAGAEYVISTQNLAAEKIRKKDDFARNDGEHPCLYLRPLIAYQVLHNIPELYNNDDIFLEKIKTRWKTYCKDAGQLKCRCGKTRKASLKSLEAEATKIVDAILHGPIWPNNQRLIDLVRPVKKDTNEEWLDSLPQFTDDDTNPIPPLHENDIPQAIKGIWKFLKKHIPDLEGMSQREKNKKHWETLVSMSIEDKHGHWPVGAHSDLQFHWWAPWAGTHTHNPGIT